MIKPIIRKIEQKNLIGYRLKMSILKNQTGQLWGQFGPKIKEIKNRMTEDKISMQIYEPSYFQKFNPATEFEKWATVEVENFDNVPTGMETFILNKGLYAVFYYQGSSVDNSIFQHIFGHWLPNSPYELDDRPHFEVLGAKYKNNDLNSEEEIWIPVVLN